MRRILWAALAAAAAGCGESKVPDGEGALVYARGADSEKLDPQAIEDGESVNVVSQIFDTLVAFERNSPNVEAALATEWKDSDGGRTWTFRLRTGVKFHDGTPFDAAAVVAHFRRLTDESERKRTGLATAPYSGVYADIEGVEAKGAQEVVFRLKRPNGVFLANLAMFPGCISSPAAVEKHKADYGQHPVGTGPFKFVSWTPNQTIVLEANPDYWGGAPKSKKLVFAVIPDNSVRLQRLKAGEIHIMDGVSLSDLGRIRSDASLKLMIEPGMNFAYLAFNTEKAPFDRADVRQAIASAIDKKELLDLAYAGVGHTGPNALPPSVRGYNDRIPDYPYDPAQAKKTLEAAGLTGRKVALYVMPNPRAYVPDPANVGAVLKRRLEAVGLAPELTSPAWETYRADLKEGRHDIALIGWITDNGDPDNFLHALFHSSMIPQQNHARYRSKEFDALVEAAQVEILTARRIELYEKAQERMRKDTPVIPLAYLPNIAATRSNVQGYALHPMGLVRLKDAHLAK
jgi:peptide/nickel transport system substrate-binding protein